MTEHEMRAYLLGQATATDAERLEVRLLEDEDVYATLQGIEDDLFDDYASGSLSEPEQRQFLERYGTERPRLLVAHALAARNWSTSDVASPPSTGRRWLPLAAAAVMVIGAGLAIWTRSAPEHAPSAALPAQGASTPPRAPIVIKPIVMNLTLGTSRSGTTLPEAVLPAEASMLDLRIRLNPADRFDSYGMELRSATGAPVWRADRLTATAVNGNLFVAGSVPANVLPAGTYELTVRGAGTAATGDVLGYAGLSIRR